jgi:hypothetical protein
MDDKRTERVEAYTKIATTGLLAAVAFIGIEPLLTGKPRGDQGIGHFVIHDASPVVDWIPWYGIAIVASLIPLCIEAMRRIPRRVIYEPRERFMADSGGEDLVREDRVFQH